ncbi:polysaccharide deacetylase [Streptomyces sp. NRRL F-6491]|nr:MULTISPECIES: polysaccharide deacetylase family protein [unclassified Streptomyces]KOX22842.1 polysaccharide deacetylase [Streptomyces sp. NRRL F-6491]KOX40062.1 polysaccharide deacetylase [Streptomyces sp. NRRL F-6492]
MQLVRQKEKKMAKGVHRSRRTLGAALAVAALASAATACSGAGPDRTAPPSPASGRQAPKQGAAAAPESQARKAEKLRLQKAARALAAKKWGLAKPPLEAPAPPAVKPKITTRKGFETKSEGVPPVFTTVPTKEKIVFLTIDDGSEKDPELLRMMDELKIPYSAFLSDYVISDDYAYFARMQKSQKGGVVLNNHTLNHRYLPGLSYSRQEREICGMQDVIEKKFGKRPTLFRPPYGNYNDDTLRAAGSCGIKAVPLWAAEAFPDRMEWREWDRDLHPGDIVLTHFRGEEDWKGSMADMVRRVMNVITAKGYAVAKLEDYV